MKATVIAITLASVISQSALAQDSIDKNKNFGGGESVINLELSKGANAMLHGYVPKEGDIVEWYVRKVDDCAVPEKKCNFGLALRKRPEGAIMDTPR